MGRGQERGREGGGSGVQGPVGSRSGRVGAPAGVGGGLLACGPDLPAHAAARRVGVGGGAGWRGGGGPVCVGGLMARVMAAIAVWRLRMTTPAGRRRAGVARRAGRRRDRPGVR